jgi:uncharacterized protein YdeI (YjbR/CyaY-like superfamily)
MSKKDKRVDTYISKSQDFAKPVLSHLRELVHKACPEVEETIKWGFPNFVYKGILCNMASFKQHCAFGFWKASLMKDTHGILAGESMGSLGKLASLKDLPADKILIDYIKQAMELNDEGIKVSKKPVGSKKDLVIPDYFKKELGKNKKAKTVFENFGYSHQKEYIEWITEAKTEATRLKRMEKTLAQLAESKSLNWKYA